MHLTSVETYLLIQGIVAVLGGAAAWLRADAAHRTAGKADGKASKALQQSAAVPAQGTAADSLGPEG